MKLYSTLSEARAAVKKAVGSVTTIYIVNHRQVSASEYRQAHGNEIFYRSGVDAVAEKTMP